MANKDKLIYRKKYNIPQHLKILPEVFHHKCGLQFVNQKELNYLQGKPSITAGAYWGDSALVLQDITKSTVYGFEPNQHNFSLFKEIININMKTDVIVPKQQGLSDTTGFCYIDDCNLSVSSKISNNIEGNKVKVTSIDDFIKQENIANLGLIHLDIEGLETNVINGAKATIEKYKPVLLISIYHNAEDFFDLKPLIESWQLNYNFKIRKLHRKGFELMLIATPNL